MEREKRVREVSNAIALLEFVYHFPRVAKLKPGITEVVVLTGEMQGLMWSANARIKPDDDSMDIQAKVMLVYQNAMLDQKEPLLLPPAYCLYTLGGEMLPKRDPSGVLFHYDPESGMLSGVYATTNRKHQAVVDLTGGGGDR